jgi:hypothetical protein
MRTSATVFKGFRLRANKRWEERYPHCPKAAPMRRYLPALELMSTVQTFETELLSVGALV